MSWYIVTANLDKPHYTAYKDINCKHLLRLGDNRCKLPRHITFRKELGVHSPCSYCATEEKLEWWKKDSVYFTNNPHKLSGYHKVNK
jgi:hypothetical protein